MIRQLAVRLSVCLNPLNWPVASQLNHPFSCLATSPFFPPLKLCTQQSHPPPAFKITADTPPYIPPAFTCRSDIGLARA